MSVICMNNAYCLVLMIIGFFVNVQEVGVYYAFVEFENISGVHNAVQVINDSFYVWSKIMHTIYD